MKSFSLISQANLLRLVNASSYGPNPRLCFNPMNATPCLQHMKTLSKTLLPSRTSAIHRQTIPFPLSFNQADEQQHVKLTPKCQELRKDLQKDSDDNNSWFLISGAVSIGILLLFATLDDQKALALGPEGPLVEEFWDNVRRYALYALTVSTGAIYTIFQPIVELLKNPISAILVLVILGGSMYVVSQVVSAMVGVTDFTYYYGY